MIFLYKKKTNLDYILSLCHKKGKVSTDKWNIRKKYEINQSLYCKVFKCHMKIINSSSFTYKEYQFLITVSPLELKHSLINYTIFYYTINYDSISMEHYLTVV